MSDGKIKDAAIATFTQFLTQHKLRKTPERLAVLKQIFNIAGHFSIEELHEKLEQNDYHVSRATIYNTIELLTACGLVHRHTFASPTPQYERNTGLSRHYHLVCMSCGKVREIKDLEIQHIITNRRFGKFQPAFIDLNIYGLCQSCSKKNKTTTIKQHTN